MNNQKPKQCIVLVLLRPVCYEGVITMEEILLDVKSTMTLISLLTENTVFCDQKECNSV
jgi:multisubunit Na+/H+ antiporter MnhF subunit